jgi:excisionase family DNA binding protein
MNPRDCSATYFTLPQAAAMLGISYMTVYRWVRAGKLKPEKVWGRQIIPLEQLRQVATKKCANCYHLTQVNGINMCQCRETTDMQDGCKDWAWRWNYQNS